MSLVEVEIQFAKNPEWIGAKALFAGRAPSYGAEDHRRGREPETAKAMFAGWPKHEAARQRELHTTAH